MNITGAIYFPTETVSFTNGISNPSGCTQLIAGLIAFNGGANFNSNCSAVGTRGINTPSPPRLSSRGSSGDPV
jgi:hypothetical protein